MTTSRSRKERKRLNQRRRRRARSQIVQRESHCRICDAELFMDEINCCESCFRKVEADFYLQHVL